MNEHIRHEGGDPDAWVCIYGNTSAGAGFYPELVPFEMRITAETVVRALAEDNGKDVHHTKESDQ